jgi:hypothetical protein
MEAVHNRQNRPAVITGLLVLGAVAALMLAGVVGYLVKGSPLPTVQQSVQAVAPAHSIAGVGHVVPYGEHYSGDVARAVTSVTAGGPNSSDSKSGYASGLGTTTSGVVRGLNADSASGYTATR